MPTVITTPGAKKAISDPFKLEIVEGRWVFKSWEDFKLILEPVRRKKGIDSQGELVSVELPTSSKTGRSVRATFTHGAYEATPESARQIGLPFKNLVELMLHNPQFGRKYKLTSAPGFAPDEGLRNWSEKMSRRAESKFPKTTQGVKAR